MADFHEVRFPTSISRGSSGGPRRRTDIVTLRSGYEERNSVWADSRREYDAGLGIRDIGDLHDVLAFFEARLGRLYGFRWKDWADYKSCAPNAEATSQDQNLGPVETGVAKQITKAYISGSYQYTRVVSKITVGSGTFWYNGIDVTGDCLVDTASGLFVYLGPTEPGQGIFAGYEFDVPVRFVNDHIDVSVEQFNAGSLPQLNTIEVKPAIYPDASLLEVPDEFIEIFSVYHLSSMLSLANIVDYAVNEHWENFWS